MKQYKAYLQNYVSQKIYCATYHQKEDSAMISRFLLSPRLYLSHFFYSELKGPQRKILFSDYDTWDMVPSHSFDFLTTLVVSLDFGPDIFRR